MAEIITIPEEDLQFVVDIDLDFLEAHSDETVRFPQYDSNTRYIRATVYTNGTLYQFTTDQIITFNATKPDTHGIDNPANIDSQGRIVYEITEQTTNYPGAFQAEFRVYDTKVVSGVTVTRRKTPFTFKIYVAESALSDTAIISTNEFKTLTDLIATVGDLTVDVNEAVATANEAITNANNATSLATTAATNANLKATLADQKATLANEKAILADQKASLADIATGNANTATTNAINAAILANEKATLANDKATLAINATLDAITATENANIATQAALDAAGDVTASNNYASQSKRWAVGGVISGDENDNAKVYALQAQNAAEIAQEYSTIIYPNLQIDITTGVLSSVGGENITFTLDINGNLISEVTV